MSFRRPRAVLEGKLSNPVPRGAPQAAAVLAGPPISFGTPVVVAPRPSAVFPHEVREAAQPAIRIGSVLLSWYLFFYFGRILDLTAAVTKSLHVPMFLQIGIFVLALAAGGIWTLTASRIGNLEMFFVVWVGVATAFSSWRSGSLLVFRDCVYSATIFFAVLALVRNMKQLSRIARAMAFAGLAAALLSFFFTQDMRGGRIAVSIGTLADPNEYALILLMTLPYWWLAARNSQRPKLMGTMAFLAAIPILVAFFRAGSRAGLLTLGGLVVAIFFRARPAQRVALVVGVVIIAAVALVALPSELRSRYSTWFSSDDQRFGADIDSAMSRRYLLTQSLKFTIQHPLFGVGPGQFGNINWETSKAAGIHIAAYPTHNTYTEVSSETGVPGLILFAGTLILCFRSTLQILRLSEHNPSLRPLSNAAKCVFISITAFLIGAFFLSLAYSALVTVAVGLSAALRNVATGEYGLVLKRS